MCVRCESVLHASAGAASCFLMLFKAAQTKTQKDEVHDLCRPLAYNQQQELPEMGQGALWITALVPGQRQAFAMEGHCSFLQSARCLAKDQATWPQVQSWYSPGC